MPTLEELGSIDLINGGGVQLGPRKLTGVFPVVLLANGVMITPVSPGLTPQVLAAGMADGARQILITADDEHPYIIYMLTLESSDAGKLSLQLDTTTIMSYTVKASEPFIVPIPSYGILGDDPTLDFALKNETGTTIDAIITLSYRFIQPLG